MTRIGLLLAALLASASPVLAQPVPFDMTPESELVIAPPAPASQPDVPDVPAPVVVAPQRSEHFILPGAVRLTGEQSRAASVIYLTQAQADAPARLNLSYINALVVAPEISALTIRINNSEIVRRPLASSAVSGQIAVDIPSGLLRQGANTIELLATQRHRTDCTVNSTYELWTQIDSGTATLSFEGDNLGQVSQLADLAAIGVDAEGHTTIRLIAPSLGQPEATDAAVILAQQLALVLRVPDLRVEMATELSQEAAPGVLDVVLGTADQLPEGLAGYAVQAGSGAIAAIVPQSSGVNTLLVSGPDWQRIAQASDAILAAAPVSADRPRVDLPDALPMITGGETLSLADFGLSTVEFNGRRLTTSFQFLLPPDFYANNYGEAELVLDAAYAADVLPGSEIDIYTNAQIASATPLLRTDGGRLRDTAIRFPMTNLRPGRNVIEVIVNLNTQSDAVCSAGWTGQAPGRFVFSSSTQLRVPQFARAAALPDLELLTGSAWPYSDATEVPLVVGEGLDAAVSAMTLMARAASASDRVLPVNITSEAQLSPDQNAILVMPISEMSAPTKGRSGLTEGTAGTSGSADVLDQFAASGDHANPFIGFADRMLKGVGLSIDDLRVLPRQDSAYPVSSGSVVMAQSMQPEGGLWTVLSSSDSASMRAGMERMAVTEQWRQVGGRVSTLLPTNADVTSIETVSPVVVQTQPFSLQNARLVAANWFSGNILYFSAALALVAILLMLSTALVLTRSGRRQ